MADVFISYSRTDRPLAERLSQALERHGLSIWMDSNIAGGSTFTKVTEEELNRAGKVVVLWSKTSVDSGWVCDEAQAGREQGKLVPLSVDGSLPPMGFRQLQTIDMAGWTAGKEETLPRSLLDALALDGSAKTPVPSQPRRRGVLAGIAIAVLLLAGAALWAVFGPVNLNAEERTRVVVMPFTAAGSDADEKALASGITSELIVRLRRIAELQVATGRDDEKPGDTALYGSVRKDGDQLRVAARLEDRSGNVIWSDNFDRQLVDLLAVQEDIAKAVSETLSVSLDIGIASRDFGGTDNPEAYADYVQGRSYRYGLDRNRPLSYLQRAVALDPDFIRGWEELSYIYGVSLYTVKTATEADELMARLDETSARALKLNPDLWYGLSARGWYDFARGDLRAAAAKFRRIAQLDRGKDAGLRETLALAQLQFGRVRKAGEIQRSMTLIDPYYRRDRLQEDFFLGNLRELKQRFEQDQIASSALWAEAPEMYYWIDIGTGDYAAAREIARKLDWDPLFLHVPDFHFDPGYMPDLPPDQLKAWADRTYGAGDRRQLVWRAMFASQFGHQEQAMDYLNLAFQRPGYGGNHYIWYPALAKLRETDAFVEWIRQRGLVDIWRESGDWGDFCQPVGADGVTCH